MADHTGTSNYPGAIDDPDLVKSVGPGAGDPGAGADLLDARAAIKAVQTELGVDPSGPAASVASRIALAEARAQGFVPCSDLVLIPNESQLNSTNTHTGQNARWDHQILFDIDALKLVYVNPTTYLNRVRAGVKPLAAPSPDPEPVWFRGGARYADLSSNAATAASDLVVSDALQLHVDALEFVRSQTFIQAGTAIGGSTNDRWALNELLADDSGGRAGTTKSNGETDKSLQASPLAGSYEFAPGPAVLLGRPRTLLVDRVLAFLGASISAGANDAYLGGSGVARPSNGFGSRACNGKHPYVNLSRGGEIATDWASSGHRHRRALLEGVTDCVTIDLGSNDIALSASLATVQTSLAALGTMLKRRGIRGWLGSIPPRPGLSGPQATVRQQLNDSMRANAAFMANWTGGYLETADVLEVSRNSNTWKTGMDSGDTVHPDDTGHIALASFITTAMNL